MQNIHSFSKYLLNPYYGSETMLNVRYETTANTEMVFQLNE
jgi:hypothetical protein